MSGWLTGWDLETCTPKRSKLEELGLEFYLDDLRRQFGPDDPFVKSALQNMSPADAAHYYVTHTQLGDVAYRKKLYAADAQRRRRGARDPQAVRG